MSKIKHMVPIIVEKNRRKFEKKYNKSSVIFTPPLLCLTL